MSGIREKDLEERFIRSRGPGGQNVNKTSTCVHLRHVPTGIDVKCREERSQSLNRARAREILTKKIERALDISRLEKEQQKEKLRRQHRKKPQQVKLRILETKRRHSQKKSLRAPVKDFD